MKQVWKCDHCFETNEYSEVILMHEVTCNFNPVNKKCYTCKYHGWFFDIEECGLGYNIFKVTEEEINCKNWTNKQ